MKVNLKTTTETLREASVSVEKTDNGDVCVVIKVDRGETRRCFMSTEYAVMMWRCLTGESESCMFEYRTVPEKDAVPEKIAVTYVDRGAVWNIVMRNASFLVSADQALSLAWALKKCVSDVLAPCGEGQSKTKDIALGHSEAFSSKEKSKDVAKIWMLVSSSVRNHGDHKVEMTKGMTVNAKAFDTREAALDELREFLREEVNCTHSEEHFEDLQDHGRDVDDILDDILEEGNFDERGGFWKYDGTERSFFVKLIPVVVCKKGES
jgi:hypothetical protein